MGTFYAGYQDHYFLYVDYEISQNAADRTSTISLNPRAVNKANWGWDIQNPKSGSSTVDSNTQYWTESKVIKGSGLNIDLGVKKLFVVKHNADGTHANVKLSVTWNWGYPTSSITASTTISLPRINTASTPSLSKSSADFGTTITINTNRQSTDFSHILYYSFNGGAKTQINTESMAYSSWSWTIPSDRMNNIPSATSGKFEIICETYIGSTLIGTTRGIYMTATVPSSVKPSITAFSITPTGAFNGKYVQGKTSLSLKATTYSAPYSASIDQIRWYINGGLAANIGSTPFVYTPNVAGNLTIGCVVRDTRGRDSDVYSVTVQIQEYHTPAFVYSRAERCDEFGNLIDSGQYLKCTAKADFSSIAGLNGASMTITVLSQSGGVIVGETQLQDEVSLVIGNDNVSEDNSYIARFKITDLVGTTGLLNVDVLTSFSTEEYLAGGRGIAFGKAAEYEDTFEINPEWDVRMKGKVIDTVTSGGVTYLILR